MIRTWPIVVCLGLLAACSSSDKSESVAGVQAKAVAAADAQSSHIVLASGELTQGDIVVDIALNYAEDQNDGLHYDSKSTSSDGSAQIALVSLPPKLWSKEGDAWETFEAADLSAFNGRRMWSLFPFDQAEISGEEMVDGRLATRYHATAATQASIPDLVGTFIASDDVELSGEFAQVEIDYWVDAEHGWPVKATYRATGDATLELAAILAQVNDPTIVITAPPE